MLEPRKRRLSLSYLFSVEEIKSGMFLFILEPSGAFQYHYSADLDKVVDCIISKSSILPTWLWCVNRTLNINRAVDLHLAQLYLTALHSILSLCFRQFVKPSMWSITFLERSPHLPYCHCKQTILLSHRLQPDESLAPTGSSFPHVSRTCLYIYAAHAHICLISLNPSLLP